MDGQVVVPQLVTREPQACAVVRETVPMSELQGFFARAFGETMAVANRQGKQVVGPPFGLYFGMPTDTIDVAAGFPVEATIEAEGSVVPYELPGGRAVELVHMGPYDDLGQSYERLLTWMREQNLTPAEMMWESYLNEPRPDAPGATITVITWPVA